MLQLLATAVLADSQRQDFQRPRTRATAMQAMSKCLRISRFATVQTFKEAESSVLEFMAMGR